MSSFILSSVCVPTRKWNQCCLMLHYIHQLVANFCALQFFFLFFFFKYLLAFLAFIDMIAEDLDRKQDQRESEWHAAKGPRPTV